MMATSQPSPTVDSRGLSLEGVVGLAREEWIEIQVQNCSWQQFDVALAKKGASVKTLQLMLWALTDTTAIHSTPPEITDVYQDQGQSIQESWLKTESFPTFQNRCSPKVREQTFSYPEEALWRPPHYRIYFIELFIQGIYTPPFQKPKVAYRPKWVHKIQYKIQKMKHMPHLHDCISTGMLGRTGSSSGPPPGLLIGLSSQYWRLSWATPLPRTCPVVYIWEPSGHKVIIQKCFCFTPNRMEMLICSCFYCWCALLLPKSRHESQVWDRSGQTAACKPHVLLWHRMCSSRKYVGGALFLHHN